MTAGAYVSRDQVAYALSRHDPPRLTIDSSTVVTFETHDARGGRLQRPDQVEETTPDFRERFPKTNPATGPIFVRGAAPGDRVVVEIMDIDLDDAGFVLVKPDMGIVRGLVARPIARICRVVQGEIHFGDLRFPVRPMVGVIGVAPAGEPIGTAFVGRHGGNIDSNRSAVGSRIVLPVQVPGGLVYLGDVHASMGDGEVSGTGVEIGARVRVRISLEKGGSAAWPRIDTRDRWICIASAPTYEEASEIAVREMMADLQARLGLAATDAFMLISAIGDVRVNQACRSAIDVSVRVEMPKLGDWDSV
jgi:amidase